MALRMILPSIRWRFLLWMAFLLVCILSGFGVTAYRLHRTNEFQRIDKELEGRVASILADLRGGGAGGLPRGRPPLEPWNLPGTNRNLGGPPPGRGPLAGEWEMPPPHRGGPDGRGPRGRFEDFPEPRELRLSEKTQRGFEAADPQGFYFAAWSHGGGLLKQATNAPAGLAVPQKPRQEGSIHTRIIEERRELFQYNGLGECVLVGRSIAPDLHSLRRFGWWLAAAGAAVLALGLGGGWWLAGRALLPVEEISQTASRISLGNLSERINVRETDSELGRLAGVLNSTFARLEAAFAQQKQFTADASHELRTPLAVLISEAQTTLARERSAAEYRETVEACLETAQQMKRLTQSLLELARFDAGQELLERQAIDLAVPVRACVEMVRTLAEARGLALSCHLETARTVGDGDRLCQVVTNLLSNAIEYNRERGAVSVSTRMENGDALVTVRDTGLGIAEEDLPRLFARFQRAATGRSCSGGHAGLGLAISKAIVTAHGGDISVKSQLGAGTEFTIRLPGASAKLPD